MAGQKTQKTFLIEGIIGLDILPSQVFDFLKSADNSPVRFQINSPGGFVFDAIAIHNLILQYPAEVEIEILSLCASSASFISTAGDIVSVFPDSVYMLHNAWLFSFGDHNKLREDADHIEKISNLLVHSYSNFSKKSVDEIKSLMDAETFLFGKEIVESGFAHQLIDEKDFLIDDIRSALDYSKKTIQSSFVRMSAYKSPDSDILSASALIDKHYSCSQASFGPAKSSTCRDWNAVPFIRPFVQMPSAHPSRLGLAETDPSRLGLPAKSLTCRDWAETESYADTAPTAHPSRLDFAETDLSRLGFSETDLSRLDFAETDLSRLGLAETDAIPPGMADEHLHHSSDPVIQNSSDSLFLSLSKDDSSSSDNSALFNLLEKLSFIENKIDSLSHSINQSSSDPSPNVASHLVPLIDSDFFEYHLNALVNARLILPAHKELILNIIQSINQSSLPAEGRHSSFDSSSLFSLFEKLISLPSAQKKPSALNLEEEIKFNNSDDTHYLESFALPVDPQSRNNHLAILEIMKKHNCNYISAYSIFNQLNK